VNILIIGGLLVLAVVAILGAVLLSRSDEANGAAAQTTPVLQAPTPAHDRAKSDPAPATAAAAANRQQASLLNGQFHEMAGEIRTLHQQAWQLEQRLSALTEMVNQLELTHNDDGNVETVAHRSPSESITG
jgi:hypothetical protein